MSIPQVEAVEGREDTATRFVRMGRGMAAIVTHAQAGEADIRLYPLYPLKIHAFDVLY